MNACPCTCTAKVAQDFNVTLPRAAPQRGGGRPQPEAGHHYGKEQILIVWLQENILPSKLDHIWMCSHHIILNKLCLGFSG